MEKITIKDRSFIIAEPTLIVLDSIKNKTGFDLALGINKDDAKNISSDIKTIATVFALIVKDNPDEEYNEDLIEDRVDYFFKYGKMSDFIKTMVFFSNVLNGSENDSSQPAKPKTTADQKPKMKLLKKK